MHHSLNKLLSERLADVLLHGKWIAGTNWQEELQGTNGQLAGIKYEHLNSIAALCFHINYYMQGLCHVFDGNTLNMSDKYSFELPLPLDEKAWTDLRNLFLENAHTMIRHVENSTTEFLLGNFTDPHYGSWQNNIEAFIEHAYYHLGQVVLLRKLILPASNE